jgi:thiol-disulfide isomerase/thioredoxin
MSDFNGTNIIFLEVSDFNNNILTYNNKPVSGIWIVMVQGSFCHFCTQAKPAFIKASEQLDNKVVFATVQIDGPAEEKALGKKIPEITNVKMEGVPAYLIFKNGKFAELYNGGRSANDLVNHLSGL